MTQIANRPTAMCRHPTSADRSSVAPSSLGRALPLPDYAALVEAAGDFIYTLDLEGRFTFLNRAASRVLGYPVNELLGKKFTVILTRESAAVALEHFGQGLSGTEATPFFEVEAVRKDGGHVLLEVRAGSLYRDGALVGRQGIGRDISELRSLQQVVAAKSERLALLEERTRIAMSLYARIAQFAGEDSVDAATSSQALRQLHDATLHVAAERKGLTAIDLTVLELLARGSSNREIAAAVHRSPHTIKDHVRKIKARLGAKRRAELVANALKLGLITHDR